MDSRPIAIHFSHFHWWSVIDNAVVHIKLIRNSTNECTNAIRIHFMRMSTTTRAHRYKDPQSRWWMILNHNRTNEPRHTYFTPKIFGVHVCVCVCVGAFPRNIGKLLQHHFIISIAIWFSLSAAYYMRVIIYEYLSYIWKCLVYLRQHNNDESDNTLIHDFCVRIFAFIQWNLLVCGFCPHSSSSFVRSLYLFSISRCVFVCVCVCVWLFHFMRNESKPF